jgi:hypothetical protein
MDDGIGATHTAVARVCARLPGARRTALAAVLAVAAPLAAACSGGGGTLHRGTPESARNGVTLRPSGGISLAPAAS